MPRIPAVHRAAPTTRFGHAHLGLDLVDDPSGYYKVSYVYENGPADKDWIKVAAGDFLIAFDGKPLKVGDDYWERLGRRLNRKVELTLNSKPDRRGFLEIKYEPISSNAYADLRYDRWVKERRALTDKLSNGRVGYLHIKAMDQPSLAKFRKELSEFRHKEALVIDERFNGGGNIEQELLAILVQRPSVWQPRGTEPTQRPFTGYYDPKVLLQNWRSASNAEMFPAGFRALGLGKVVGTPTMGAVIGTGSYTTDRRLHDPHAPVGVYLADHDRTNMENHPVTARHFRREFAPKTTSPAATANWKSPSRKSSRTSNPAASRVANKLNQSTLCPATLLSRRDDPRTTLRGRSRRVRLRGEIGDEPDCAFQLGVGRHGNGLDFLDECAIDGGRATEAAEHRPHLFRRPRLPGHQRLYDPRRLNQTPNIDRIARQGVRFDRCLVTNSICGPSRAAVLTGKYSHLNGFYNNTNSRFDGCQTTFPKLLQSAGYQTAMFGKWHLVSDPTGFDYWHILPGQGVYYNPPMIHNGQTCQT